MNIGLFSDTYFPDTNGVVVSIYALEKKLRERGHNVYIITGSGHQKPDPQCNLLMLRSMPLIFNPAYRMSSFYSFRNAKIIEEVDLDIIHTHSEFSCGIFAVLMAAQLGIPLVHTFHTMWEDYIHYVMPASLSRKNPPKAVTRRMIRSFLHQFSEVIAPTQAIAGYLREQCNIRKKPISVIPTGLNLAPFKKENHTAGQIAALKQAYGLQNNRVILFVGRIGKEKSIDVILKSLPCVFEKHPDARMLIVGGGPEMKPLKKLARELQIDEKVIFAGSKPSTEIALHYAIADVFITASITETQGLTYIEAMASGIPVVAKAAPNLQDILIHGQNGYLFSQDDALPALLNFVFDNPSLQEKIIQKAYRTTERFCSERFADDIEQAYLRAISRYRKVQSAHRMLVHESTAPRHKIPRMTKSVFFTSRNRVTRATRLALKSSRRNARLFSRGIKFSRHEFMRLTGGAISSSKHRITKLTKQALKRVKSMR